MQIESCTAAFSSVHTEPSHPCARVDAAHLELSALSAYARLHRVLDALAPAIRAREPRPIAIKTKKLVRAEARLS